MSTVSIILAALFVLGMVGLGLALFLRGTRERAEVSNPLPNWARPRS